MNSKIPCQTCNGLGYSLKLNIIKARQEKITCPTCRGTGNVFVESLNGIVCQRQVCQVMYWQDFVNNEPVSTLHIHVCPVMDNKTGQPSFKPDIFNPKNRIPRIFLQIVNMATKPEYRSQGRMDNLLKRAMEDPKIEWVETSWEDSSDDGKGFLRDRGFVRENGKLIWRRGNPNAN